MSSLTREEVLQYLEKFAEAAWSSGPDIGKLLAHDAAQRATIEAQAQRIAKLEARLEIDHVYDQDMNRIEIKPEDRDRHPDGILCRDATIRGLEDQVTEREQRIRELEEKNVLLQSENAALKKYTPWAE